MWVVEWFGVFSWVWSKAGSQDTVPGESGIWSQELRMSTVRRMDKSPPCPARIVLKLLKNEATPLTPG